MIIQSLDQYTGSPYYVPTVYHILSLSFLIGLTDCSLSLSLSLQMEVEGNQRFE